jgi:hypothetical protein
MAHISFQNRIDFVVRQTYNGLRLLNISLGAGFPFQKNTINGNASEIGVSLNTFHAVITDFFRIQIAAVAFTVSDTFPVVQYAWTVHGFPLPFVHQNYTSIMKGRSSFAAN